LWHRGVFSRRVHQVLPQVTHDTSEIPHFSVVDFL
jgi:hypothetical protein